MAERFIPIHDFDPSGIRETLQADSRSVRDVAHGEGEAFTLGPSGTELEVYPVAGVARVTTENARVELHRVPGYRLNEANHVIFELGTEQERLRMLVGSEGHVSLRPLLRATGSPTTHRSPPDGHQDRMSPARASQDVTRTPQSAEPASPEPEERETVTFTGNLGRAPWRRHEGEEEVRGFLFAHNHTEGEQPTWYWVKARGEAAQQVAEGVRRGYIKKGQPVTITGHVVEPANKRQSTLAFEATEVRRARAGRRPSEARPAEGPPNN